jgi:hypothetical protein
MSAFMEEGDFWEIRLFDIEDFVAKEGCADIVCDVSVRELFELPVLAMFVSPINVVRGYKIFEVFPLFGVSAIGRLAYLYFLSSRDYLFLLESRRFMVFCTLI